MNFIEDGTIVASFPEGVACVGMVEFNGKLILALTCSVYVFDEANQSFKPIPIERGAV